jgi:hypothetical protein
LEDLVQELAEDKLVQGVVSAGEGASNLSVFLTDAMSQKKGGSTERVAGAVKRYTVDDKIAMEESSELAIEDDKITDTGKDVGDDLPRIVVLASGNLGLVYSTRRDTRVTLEEMETILPGMLEGLAAHEGVGFVMIHSEEHGPVVIGVNGRNYLEEKRVEGQDPLTGFGTRAAEHLIREDTFPNCPDILVNSFYNTETNEVAAFEELIGCHGGMGGYQTQPFVLYPAVLPAPDEPLIGAAAVHHLMKGWVEAANVKAIPEKVEHD